MHYMKIKWREFPMVIGRRRHREHPNQHFVLLLLKEKNAGETRACAEHTSGQGLCHFGQKVPLGRILCNFRLRMCITYFRTVHMIDVTSGHVTYVTSGHAQWSDPPQMLTELYPYTTKEQDCFGRAPGIHRDLS